MADLVKEAESHDAAHEDHPHINIFEIGAYLAVLTLTSFITAQLTQRGFWGPVTNLLFVLMVAVCKSSLVVGFFMHLRFEKNWKYVLCVPPLVLGVAMVLVILPDVGVETYQKVSNWSAPLKP